MHNHPMDNHAHFGNPGTIQDWDPFLLDQEVRRINGERLRLGKSVGEASNITAALLQGASAEALIHELP